MQIMKSIQGHKRDNCSGCLLLLRRNIQFFRGKRHIERCREIGFTSVLYLRLSG